MADANEGNTLIWQNPNNMFVALCVCLMVLCELALEVYCRGVELGGDARDVSLPISSHYQTVPSNILIK